jgi:hypothetical protein
MLASNTGIALSGAELHEIFRRASTPSERLQPPFLVRDGVASPAAVARGAAWSAHVAKSDPAIFSRVLGWRGIDPGVALRSLEPAVLPEGAPLPEWTQDLCRMLAALREPLSTPSYFNPIAARPLDVLFLSFVEGASAGPLARLRGMGVAPEVLEPLQRRLLAGLAATSASALSLPGAERDFPRGLLLAFPVLARLLTCYWCNWVEATEELLDRLKQDGAALASFLGAELGPVASFGIEDADGHDGGRCVVTLAFASGARVVYKPRDMGIDVAFGGFAGWLGAAGLDLDGVVPRVLARGGYGWAEFIAHRHAADDAELERFWRRAGQLLGVLTAIGGMDIHCGNVIAAGDRLVLVDLETVLRPAIHSPPPPAGAGTGEAGEAGATARLVRFLSASALGTCMLPTMLTAGNGAYGDFGALSSPGNGTAAPHRPSPGAPEPELLRFHGILQAGFRTALGIMRRNAAAIMAPGGPLDAFEDASVRLVFRDTSIYFRLLRLSCDHAVLRDGADRDVALEQLARMLAPFSVPPPYAAVVLAEKRALNGLDIPRFDAAAAGLNLRDRDGTVVRDMFARSTLDEARARLRALTDADDELHGRLLGLALQARLTGYLAAAPAGAPPMAAAAAGALDGARAIAHLLARSAVAGTGAAGRHERTWLCPSHRVEAGFVSMTGVNHGLGDGTLGIALFLTALARVTQDPADQAMRNGALAALRPVGTPDYRSLAPPPAGLLNGHGGQVWGWAAIARLGGPSWCLDAAADGLQKALAAPPGGPWALHDGAAGLLQGGLALLDVAPSAVAAPAALRQLATHLAQRVRVAMQVGDAPRGLMDGLAGAGHALALASARLDMPELRRIALGTLCAPPGEQMALGFGRGAAGRLLALRDAARLLPGEAVLEDSLAAAMQTMARAEAMSVDGVWNGHAGLLDAWDLAGAPGTATAQAGGLAARAVADALRTVVPVLPSVAMPGLMNGVSGVGLALLRRHQPDLPLLPPPLLPPA